ncbi:MAG: energy-coupling factor ABC transporter ATP-binding protein [Oscillospiraceae bacterium]|nr:energy-coupling factor ABC transporter ATP-binding protein [Oscillospiraceae bacterium]
MLSIREATVIYPDGTKAVDGFSLELGAGDSVALVGANGAGKTSLLLAAVGVVALAGGSVEVDGIVLSKKTLGKVRQKVGMVFQNPDDQLFMPLIRDDVAFGCRGLGLGEAETARRVDGALDGLGIGYLRDRSSLKLSGGEKRMAAIATVMAMEPSVLIFDEPTAYLDPKARNTLAKAMRALGHPRIVATHDMAFASEVCGRLVIMQEGRKMADGGISMLGDGRLMEECGLA